MQSNTTRQQTQKQNKTLFAKHVRKHSKYPTFQCSDFKMTAVSIATKSDVIVVMQLERQKLEFTNAVRKTNT